MTYFRHLASLAVCASLASLAAPATAQESYRSAPNGGRSALMGSTGVALGRDGSAPFLNPATIVRIADSNVAFSVNFYSFTATHDTGWYQPNGVDNARFGPVPLAGTGLTKNRFAVVPSTLCFFFTVAGFGDEADDGTERAEGEPQRRGRQKLAACLGNVERDELTAPALNFRSPIPNGVTQEGQSLVRSWNRLQLGPTYSAYVTNALSIGASVHAVYTSDQYAISGSSVTSAPGGGAISSELGAGGDGYSVDLAAILGAALHIGRVTVGASVQLPPVHILGTYDANLHQEYAGAAGQNAILQTGTGDFKAPPPFRVSGGIGMEFHRLKVEIDESYYAPSSQAAVANMHVQGITVAGNTVTPQAFDASYVSRANAVWNTSVGGEYFVTPSFSVLAGVSTDFTSAPPLTPALTLGNILQARQHRVATSFGIGSYGESGNLLLGTELSYGWGQAIAVNPYVLPNDWAVVDQQQYRVMLILAGSMNLKAIGRAVERVEDAIRNGKPGAK